MPDFRYCPQCQTELAPVQRGGKQRLACPSPGCGFIHWNNPVPVIGAIVEMDEQVVLVRSHGWPEHWYGLITGFLEAHETPEAGILREVQEEIGLAATLESFVGFYPFPMRNQLIMVYHLSASGDIQLDQEELATYRLVPIPKLRPWKSATGFALHDWLSARGLAPEFLPYP